MAEAIFAQKQQVYSNPEFEIRLQVPQQAKLCSTPKSEHDHGFDLLLGGGGAKDCRTDADHRGISVFAFFNALDDTKRLAGLLSIMGCEGYKAPCQPGPPGLAIPGLASATARVDAPKGWVQVGPSSCRHASWGAKWVGARRAVRKLPFLLANQAWVP
jgi:hypothetical protein